MKAAEACLSQPWWENHLFPFVHHLGWKEREGFDLGAVGPSEIKKVSKTLRSENLRTETEAVLPWQL